MLSGLWIWLGLCVLATAAPLPVPASDGAAPPELSPKDFDGMHGTYIVKFYSPYCPHCNELAPKWDSAFRDVGAGQGLLGEAVNWGSVNCVDHGDFCSGDDGQNIKAYPTVRMYRDGEMVYQLESRPLNREILRDFVLRYEQLGDEAFAETFEKPGATDKAKSLTTISSSMKGRWLVLYTKEDCEGCDGYAWMWRSGELNPEVNWGIVDCSSTSVVGLCDDIPRYPFIRVYDDGELAHTYAGSFSADALREFARGVGEAGSILDSSRLSKGATGSSDAIGAVAAVKAEQNAQPNGKHDSSDHVGSNGNIAGAGANVASVAPPAPNAEASGSGGSKGKDTSVDNAVRYAVETAGERTEEDPGKLIFGDRPEYMHGVRAWNSPSAPAPGFQQQPDLATFTEGDIMSVRPDNFGVLVQQNSEPWLVHFTHLEACNSKHCVDTLTAFGGAANKTKSYVNAAVVDCKTDVQFCRDQGVLEYPYITFYRGPVPVGQYKGEADADEIAEWALLARRSQIEHIEDYDDLHEKLHSTIGTPSFLYVSDESAMPEDWESAVQVAMAIAKWGGKVYWSDDRNVRSKVSIPHRGMVLTHVEVPGDGNLRSFVYPWSDVPLKMRNTGEILNWASSERFSSAQPLSPSNMTSWAPLCVVTVGDTPEIVSDFSTLAASYHAVFATRQIDSQKELRAARIRASDRAMADGEFEQAKNIMKQKIYAPIQPDFSFGFMNKSSLVANYEDYVPFSLATERDLFVVDFYNGYYVHMLNGWDVARIDRAAALLFSITGVQPLEPEDEKSDLAVIVKPFSKKLIGIEKPRERSLPLFSPPTSPKRKAALMARNWTLVVVSGAILLWVVFSRIVRPILVRWRRRGFTTSGKRLE